MEISIDTFRAYRRTSSFAISILFLGTYFLINDITVSTNFGMLSYGLIGFGLLTIIIIIKQYNDLKKKGKLEGANSL